MIAGDAVSFCRSCCFFLLWRSCSLKTRHLHSCRRPCTLCCAPPAAYSNPVLTLQHAREQGYAVEDFLCAPLPFGTYSSEPRVRQWITEMKCRGEAFYSQRGVYMLAAVLFKKRQPGAAEQADLTDELLRVLTVL